MLKLHALAAALLLLLAPPCAHADTVEPGSQMPPDDVHEQVLTLPGAPDRPVKLQVTVLMPDGPGPFPLAVLNHGATKGVAPEQEPRYRATFSAFYFLSRGYAVAMPMMRGFAGSGGRLTFHGCDAAGAALQNAADVAAVIDGVAALPRIDATRIVVGGQSYGGWNTLGVGALNRPGVKALVNFNGGMRESDCALQDASLTDGAAVLGARAAAPSIWFYGDNDTLFPRELWRAMHRRYTQAGGKAQLVAFGTFMDDSHQMLSHAESLPMWTPKVDAFLASVGLPSKEVFPAYLPTPFPAATRFAAIDDVAAVPYLSEAARNQYRDFLRRPPTRAFVVASNGVSASSYGGFDAIARALAVCAPHASDCRLYAVDDDVVWTPPAKVAATRVVQTFARAVPAGATTTINFAYGVNPDCSSKGVPKLWVTQKPAHGAAVVAQRLDAARFPAANPFSVCNGVKVPGMSVDYTPEQGFKGADALTFEEINLDGRDVVFQIALTVQ